ncbi:MAG: glycosyltransferase family 8 protein [Stellaceae bacterium]
MARPPESSPPGWVTKAECVSVLLCCNTDYLQHCGVLVASLLEENPRYFFEIVLVSTAALGSDFDKLRRLVDDYDNCRLTHQVFCPPPDMRLPIRVHYTIDTYTRIWVAEFFSPEVTRILYLDCDMIVVSDITELWQADLGGRTIAAVSIPGSTRCELLGIPEEFGYFSSGVILIDLRRWRETGVFDRLLEFIRQHSDKLIDADQDALNGCLYNDRAQIPYVWNVITPFYVYSYPLGLTEAAIAEVTRNAKIVHFNGASKPWMYMNRHPRRPDYYKYLSLTEWRHFKPPDRALINRLWKHASPFMPDALKRILRAMDSKLKGNR